MRRTCIVFKTLLGKKLIKLKRCQQPKFVNLGVFKISTLANLLQNGKEKVMGKHHDPCESDLL